MKRTTVAVAVRALLAVMVNATATASAAPIPVGCTVGVASITLKTVVNGVTGFRVTGQRPTCTVASGYTFRYATIGAQIIVLTPNPGGFTETYRNSPTKSPQLTVLPATYFLPWQGAKPGETPVPGYRARVVYTFSSPAGLVTTSRYTGDIRF